MRRKMNLDSVSIILARPKFPENIGSVARAMKNTGLGRLIVVNGSSPLHANAYKLASGAEDILEGQRSILHYERRSLKWGAWSERLHVEEKGGVRI